MMSNKVFYVALVVLILFYLGRYIYFLPKFNDGEQAPVFEAQLKNGDSFSLDNLKGDYVLIDFWGSWCGPCRKESPELVQLNNTFSGRSYRNAVDFHIVSIGIESNMQSWERAIVRDQLKWPYHILETERFKSPIASKYGVREIPTKYFIGPKGDILFVNPSFSELTEFLNNDLK